MARIRKDDYRKAAEERLKDALAMQEKRRYHTMVYLLGYVLECALAHRYCVNNCSLYIEDVKDFNAKVWYDHNRLVEKLMVSGMSHLLSDLQEVAKEWYVEMRYSGNQYTTRDRQQRAEELLQTTIILFKQIYRQLI